MGEGQRDGVGAALAPAVVLATGGLGQVFGQTTNPSVSTGDGVALALRAGAEVADLEFVQFHPTVLWLGPLAQGQQPLVSEAVRGEGAVLLDGAGSPLHGRTSTRWPTSRPRDVVAKAIMRRHARAGRRRTCGSTPAARRRHLAAALPDDPRVAAARTASTRSTDLIPVAPAQHYAVRRRPHRPLAAAPSIPGLYACGEVACTGVHGANRLASNSLLEGLVFAARIVSALLEAEAPRPRATRCRCAGRSALLPHGDPRGRCSR